MRRGEVWFAALTRTRRNLVSELVLGQDDGMPVESVVSFDNLRTLPREAFRRRVTTLSDARMAAACRTLRAALGCS
ncbi:MAG TPA: type II toxin-antitoxin system PemK/MazF family toxin [Acidimicrobiales bacterium]|nr:type II toxin-antitoxin system PemK/MazF family toxin [Acidimicrobiales bacterium]